ncbi:MAG: RNA 2'-phosphotransferase [Candidatus Helarchaeales archaeon]
MKKNLTKREKVKVSKYMTYLLRHHPGELKMDEQGFVDLDEFTRMICYRFENLTEDDIVSLLKENERYEISMNRVRARYGHSIPVKTHFKQTSLKILYHGTSREAAERILKDGLKSMNRQKVHLSPTIKRALQVGRRKTRHPVLLKIDAEAATKDGVIFEQATNNVIVTNEVPARYISLMEKEKS